MSIKESSAALSELFIRRSFVLTPTFNVGAIYEPIRPFITDNSLYALERPDYYDKMTPPHPVTTSLALAGLLATTAYTSDSATGDSESDDPLWTEVDTEPAWELDGYTPFGTISRSSDVFIMYAFGHDDEIVAIGFDAETGDIRWEHYATYSRTAPEWNSLYQLRGA